MTLRNRIDKLEQAAPSDDRPFIVWRSLVRRDEDGHLVEAVHSARLLPGPHGDAVSLERDRRQGETETTFLARVSEAAARLHGRSDADFLASVAWKPHADTHHTE
jgi:hypothetical protein